MISPEQFKKLIDFVYVAHELNTNDHGWTTRQLGNVPFIVHPIWCSLMVLNDTTFDEKMRETGFYVLLFHDVLEDTKSLLPSELTDEVKRLVQEMTYDNFEQEKEAVPSKPVFVQFLKLIDKVSTIYDNHGKVSCLSLEKQKDWRQYTELLLTNTEKDFGHTQSYKVAKQIVDNCGW
jgi:hypothetical protein